MLAALHVLELLREGDRPSRSSPRSTTATRSGEINSTVEDAQACIDAVAQAFSGRGEIDLGDGLSVTNADERWWVNLRPSNTEPLLRLSVEAAHDTQMASLRDGARAGAPLMAAKVHVGHSLARR